MRNSVESKKIDRILDANINRVKEGLRVSEEIARFALNSVPLTSEFKSLRHRIDSILKKNRRAKEYLRARRSASDVGKNIYAQELKRGNVAHIFFANMQRVKESLRVLEEFMKLDSQTAARAFKMVRYRMYELEKKATQKSAALRNLR